MKVTPTDGLTTPVYAKTDEDFEWPSDPFFYLLSKDGLFLCRNTPFAKSCVKAATFPPDFGGQDSFLFSKYPKIGAKDIAQVEGWFRDVAKKYGCEAAALLIWDEVEKKVLINIPKQTGGLDGAGKYVLDVKFDIMDVTNSLPATQRIIGTIHSHVYHSAYSSWTDQNDEVHWAGVHIVYGCLNKVNPEIHIEIVQDGNRFKAKAKLVMEDYDKPLYDYPKEWWDQLKCEIVPTRTVKYTDTDDKNYGSGMGYGNYKQNEDKKEWQGYQKWWEKEDKKDKKDKKGSIGTSFQQYGFHVPSGEQDEDFLVDDDLENADKNFDQDSIDREIIESLQKDSKDQKKAKKRNRRSEEGGE